MARRRRAQLLVEPDEYERLVEIAARRGVSVGSLVREAVRKHFQLDEEERRQALERIFALDLPIADWGGWEEIEAEIEGEHDAGLR